MRQVIAFTFLFSILAGHGLAFGMVKCQDEEGGWHFAESIATLPPACKEKIRKQEAQKKADEKAAKEAAELAAEERRRMRWVTNKKKKTPNPAQEEKAPAKNIEVAENCVELHAYMKKCEPYQCMFTTPIGKKVKRSVVGLTGKQCVYEEERANKMKLSCSFNPVDRNQVSKYFWFTSKAKKVESVTSKDEKGNPIYQTIINGKKTLEDPFATGLNIGVCSLNILQ